MPNRRLELQDAAVSLAGAVTSYRDAKPIERCEVALDGSGDGQETALGPDWTVKVTSEGTVDDTEGLALQAVFRAKNGSPSSAVSLVYRWDDWSEDNFVLVPGAVYAGNRFEARELPYAPCWTKIDERGPNAPTIITDVPRLSLESGKPSAFHLLAGDAATPAVGVVDAKTGTGWLFVTEQGAELGDTSIHVEESEDRGTATISFQSPGVRPHLKYEMATTKVPSPDRGHDFAPGERATLVCRVYKFPCKDIGGLFERFAEARKRGDESRVGGELAPSLPFSAAWAVQERKYNALNWKEPLGYYAVGTVDQKHQDWQVGWTGGGMSSLALLLEGERLSADRALATLRFMFGEDSQSPSGFFRGVCHNGQWYGDEFNGDPDRPHPEEWHILRKSADALYFVMKHLHAVERVRPGYSVPPEWLAGTRRLADAFVGLWRKYGQFGQWANVENGELLVGGSAACGIAPAGLALCGAYFGDESYAEVAEQSALQYYRQFTAKGVTTGGPGEILQCPDSESAFALLESYVVLYEVSGDRDWVGRAEEAALQCMTWCVSYDFRFPAGSTFGRLGMRTTGSVIANVQNKHSAPGICTLSGDSLLKLYRATGKSIYLELLRDIAGNLPQYLSLEERPIRGWDGVDLLPGYMSERVNMSDWEGADLVGEALPLSCWCEVSLMLTYAEVPGIYVNKTSGEVTVLDQVSCSLERAEDGGYALTVSNPTAYPARVKLLAENEAEAGAPLGACASPLWRRIEVGAGETVRVAL
ncbi:hypothetical protein [Cohnella sp. GCM10027633]|uniref:hypothetical protein n=1 Tax=unclassified Cohnella TaxID=2636738 RepID=UPI003635D528